MTRLERLFADYAACHRTAGNRRCHALGIPLLAVSGLGLLARLAIGEPGGVRIDLGAVLLAAAVAFYASLDPRLAAVMAALGAAAWLAGRGLPVSVLAAFHAAGWVLQGVGHARYERKSPAFARNLVHLLIGPAWLASKLVPAVRPVAAPGAPGAPVEGPR